MTCARGGRRVVLHRATRRDPDAYDQPHRGIPHMSMTTEARPDIALSPIDLGAIKARQQVTWSSGDFGRVGVTLQVVGEALAEATGVNAGERVLDVAAGNGNASLAAARRFARVTSTDYVPELLEQG